MNPAQDFKDTKKDLKREAAELTEILDEFQNERDTSKSVLKLWNFVWHVSFSERLQKIAKRAQT